MGDMLNSEEKKCGKWYVIQSMSGQENRVKEKIEQQLRLGKNKLPIYEVLVPVEKVSEVRKGEKITSLRKFFPGYILIRMDLYNENGQIDNDVWYFIRNTNGVIGFVGCSTDQKPIPLTDKEIEKLMGQLKERDKKVAPKIDFEVGEIVTIKEGAFESFEGVIEDINHEKGKLTVTVSIFGRATPVELEFWQVEKNN